MIASLPLFHRIAGQPVVVLGDGHAAQARRRLVERAGGVVIDEIRRGVDDGARLAFVAHDNPETAAGDTIRLRRAGLLVNVTDRPDLCDFVMPSILDRAPVLVAVGTGGASAGLAKALRLRLETILPQGLGRLAEALSGARDALRSCWPDPRERRTALDAALAPGGPLDPLREHGAGALTAWLDAPEGTVAPPATIELLIAGNDPDDLTLRQARLLGSADAVLHEADIAAEILDRARADASRKVIDGRTIPIPRSGLTLVLRKAGA